MHVYKSDGQVRLKNVFFFKHVERTPTKAKREFEYACRTQYPLSSF